MELSPHLAITAFLSAAVLGIAPSASAQLSARSSFDNLRYQLVDLDPNDGIDPGISFSGGSVGAFATFRDDSGAVRESAQSFSSGGPVQVFIDTPDGHFDGSATTTSASAMLSIRNGSGETFTDSFLNFVLAPYTQIIFSVDARASASSTSAPNYAFANVGVNGFIWDESGNDYYDTAGLSSYIASFETLSVTLSSAASARRGTLEVATEAVALLQPVPEPAPLAMLVGGLAVLGGLARRRMAGLRRHAA